MLEGIDVSKWQASTPNLTGLGFLFARATYGTLRDPMYATHILAAHARGLVTGAYHFGRHGDVAGQVTTFLDQAGDVDLYALDLESDGGNTPMTQAEASVFIEMCQSKGVAIGLYHSASGYPKLGQDWRWVADWRPIDEPPIAWDIWQYHGSPLDRDRFDGTATQLRNLGRTDVQAPITDATEKVITLAKGSKLFDLDGVTVLDTIDAALGPRRSPYGTATKRAMFATIGTRRVVLVNPTSIADPPAQDCTAEVAAAVTLELEAAATRAAAAVRTRP